MGLRDIARSDLKMILEDSSTGFGESFSITDPVTNVYSGLVGQINNISELIDPETGAYITGNLIAVTVSLATLSEAGCPTPFAVTSKVLKPFLVTLPSSQVYKVHRTAVDSTLSYITIYLEEYK